MSAPAFTPGPWEAAERGDYSDYEGNSRVILGDDMRIAVVQHHGTERDEANARLIAAAPELYEALRQVALETHETIPPDGKEAAFHTLGVIARIAVAALARARGEQ